MLSTPSEVQADLMQLQLGRAISVLSSHVCAGGSFGKTPPTGGPPTQHITKPMCIGRSSTRPTSGTWRCGWRASCRTMCTASATCRAAPPTAPPPGADVTQNVIMCFRCLSIFLFSPCCKFTAAESLCAGQHASSKCSDHRGSWFLLRHPAGALRPAPLRLAAVRHLFWDGFFCYK